MTLQQIFDVATEFAAVIFKQQREVRPMYITETKDGRHLPFCVPMGLPEDKDRMMAAVRLLFKLNKVERYCFMAEGWQIELKTQRGETIDLTQYDGHLHEHPDRIEVVSFIAEDRAGKQITGYYRILRPEHGPPRLATLKINSGEQSVGRLTGLLQD